MTTPPRPPSFDIYPGTSRPIGSRVPLSPGATLYGWDEDPIYKRLSGAWREFFGISHLATALGRAPKTIYKWESKGLFPKATFILNGASKNGQRRLYTRRQVDGVITAALEEGLLHGTNRFVGATLFPAKCFELFRATKAILPDPIQDWSNHG